MSRADAFAPPVPETLAPEGEVTARLVGHGITVTAQRVLLGRVLFARPQHLSADQLLVTLRERGHAVSKATVYNTLNLFAERGLVRTLCIDAERTCFDSNTAPHFHLHDLDTGELTDVPPEAVGFAHLPPLPPGTVAAGLDLVIRVRRG